ncbi:MAG: SDR family oxidoreductase [Solirubrobacteraceae bacterium]
MVVAIAGAHGKIGMRLARRLIGRGENVVGMIRNPDHGAELSDIGVRPLVCDLEQASVAEVAKAISGAGAVVFAAGAGPGSGTERKLTVDRDGAIKLLHAAQAAEVGRYLMVSSIGAEDPPDGPDVFSVYLRAKAEADAALRASDRDWTIIRPGSLNDEPGGDGVRIDTQPFHGQVTRDDVAAVLDALLQTHSSAGLILYVNGGEDSVESALRACLPAGSD